MRWPSASAGTRWRPNRTSAGSCPSGGRSVRSSCPTGPSTRRSRSASTTGGAGVPAVTTWTGTARATPRRTSPRSRSTSPTAPSWWSSWAGPPTTSWRGTARPTWPHGRPWRCTPPTPAEPRGPTGSADHLRCDVCGHRLVAGEAAGERGGAVRERPQVDGVAGDLHLGDLRAHQRPVVTDGLAAGDPSATAGQIAHHRADQVVGDQHGDLVDGLEERRLRGAGSL